jgi:hypothetical protein
MLGIRQQLWVLNGIGIRFKVKQVSVIQERGVARVARVGRSLGGLVYVHRTTGLVLVRVS